MVYFVTSDTYTHVSISFDKSLQPMYSSSRKNGSTMFPAGPCKEHFHRGYYKKHPTIPCALYELEVSDDVYAIAKSEVEKIINHSEDYSFNIIGLILCQLNIPSRRKKHYFCSQFVGEILHRSRALELPKDTSLMRPSDYMQIPNLVCRYNGWLGDLLHMQTSSVVI